MNKQVTIQNQDELRNAIEVLENKRALQSEAVRKEFWVVYESLKPVNLIRSTIAEVQNSPDLSGNIINSAIGMASGVLANKLYVGDSQSQVRKVMGTLLMFGVRKMISQNQPVMNAIGKGILKLVSKSEHPEVAKDQH